MEFGPTQMEERLRKMAQSEWVHAPGKFFAEVAAELARLRERNEDAWHDAMERSEHD